MTAVPTNLYARCHKPLHDVEGYNDDFSRSPIKPKTISFFESPEYSDIKKRSAYPLGIADTIDKLLHRAIKAPLYHIVIDAEVMKVHERDKQEFIEMLKRFILHCRDDSSQLARIARGCAIRKCLKLVSLTDLSWAEQLLGDFPNDAFVELEVAKTISDRYSSDQPLEANPHPGLDTAFASMVEAYLHPKFCHASMNYTTIIMSAAQSIWLMTGSSSSSVLGVINEKATRPLRRRLRNRMNNAIVKRIACGSNDTTSIHGIASAINVR